MAVTASSRRGAHPQRASHNSRGVPKGPRHKDPLTTKTRDITMRDSRPSTSARSGLITVSVTGWRKSKAATNDDGGVSSLVKFLERRATIAQNKNAESKGVTKRQPVRIRKTTTDGDALIVSVSSEDVKSLLSANGYEWAGVIIKMELLAPRGPRSSAASFSFGNRRSTSPIDLGDPKQLNTLFKGVLARRYNVDTKLLDLSALGKDPDFNSIGVTDITSRSSFFKVLMKICDEVFPSLDQKRESVTSISLAQNNLKDVTPVTTLSQTFPDLQNLDLSGNQLSSMKDLSRWKFKFRKLEHLVVSNNPLEQNEPDFRTQIIRWYPSLRLIDLVEIPPADLEAIRAKKGPPKVQKGRFEDQGGIAEHFLTTFFNGYDNDRPGLVQYYYDSSSTFSLMVNTHALRHPSQPKMQQGEWSAYIRDSRNLLKTNSLTARMSRSHQGADAISAFFTQLPATRHPNFVANPEKWLIECQQQPGVPDPTGASPGGVNGLLVTVHGEFEEVEGGKRRSFDRTFVLGPGENQVRVISDMITIRAYGGYEAFQPEVAETPSNTEAMEKEMMIVEFSRLTGMNKEYSMLCLEQVGYVPTEAMAAFERVKGTIPPEAFVQQ